MEWKSFILTLIILLAVLITGWFGLVKISGGSVVCDDPYLRVEDKCCLDANDNKVCDEHENAEVLAALELRKNNNNENEDLSNEITTNSVDKNNAEDTVEQTTEITTSNVDGCTPIKGLSCMDLVVEGKTKAIAMKLYNGNDYDLNDNKIDIIKPNTFIACSLLCTNGCLGESTMGSKQESTWVGEPCVGILEPGYEIIDWTLKFTYKDPKGTSISENGKLTGVIAE